MKPHFKPLANLLQTAWRKAIILHFAFSILHSAFAAVPLAWQVTPHNPAPVAFDRHHGETLEFRCVFYGFGELPFGQAADIRLWYQTNGMAAAWWSVPAFVSSNVLSATFPPQADPGADRLSLFFGAPSNAYASAVLRLRHSPGFTPNILPPPDVTNLAEDLAAVRALIDYSTSNADLVATIMATAPTPGNYETVSNRAMSAIQNEQDPTVPAWAKSATPPASMATNDVKAIVTNEVPEFTQWECNPPLYGMLETQVIRKDGHWYIAYVGGDTCSVANENNDPAATNLTWSSGWDGAVDTPPVVFTATRSPTGRTQNELGLARMSDLPEIAAAAVYDVHDLRWDEEEQILYWCKFVGGHDLCIAVTNINLTHPTNAVLLKKWRETNR